MYLTSIEQRVTSIEHPVTSIEKAGFLRLEDMPKAPLVMNSIPLRFMQENRIIPLGLKNNILSVVMADPDDGDTIEAMMVAASVKTIRVHSADRRTIDEYFAQFYGQEPQNINRIIEEITDREEFEFLRQDADEDDVGHLKDLAAEAPIIKLVNMIMTRAVENRASDIHIEPFEDELKVRYRIDGILHDSESMPGNLQAAIVSRIKLTARLNIAERRLPQDGRIRIRVAGKELDLRVSTIPVLYGESVVMRVLDRDAAIMDLDRLGFNPLTFSIFQGLIHKPNGVLFVTGPTGSGKTTTLYSALSTINFPDRKIITVEDPIEYRLKGINQIQVRPQIGLNFANTLRHIVRQDPDIIMIGETRDLETAGIAIQSSLTGHLVFSTLHTNDAPGAITRLIDMGVENFLISSTVRGILAQRLVRVICPACKQIDASSDGREQLSLLGIKKDEALYQGSGCEICSHTGYHGRIGIFELLVVDDPIRRLIMENADANDIRAMAIKNGMQPMIDDGIKKVRSGITTFSEVFRVIQEA